MKRSLANILCVLCVMILCSCVPTEATSVNVDPDFSGLGENEAVELDFIQLHNETLEFFPDPNPYAYIRNLEISGNNEKKMIYVTAVCMDEANADEQKQFLSAVLRHIADAAYTQDPRYGFSDSASFGRFWEKYGLNASVYTESEMQKDQKTPVLAVSFDPGEPVPGLDPAIEPYEEEWEQAYEIFRRDAVYDVEGHLVTE